jgi:hypothetical protein
MKTFNIATSIPINTQKMAQVGIVMLRYTKHALEQCEVRSIRRFKGLDTAKVRLIEVTVNAQGQAVKALYRARHDEHMDVCLVVCLEQGSFGVVKTTWLNSCLDNHESLNTNNYAKVA